MTWFLLGILGGVLLTIPLAAIAARRAARRVRRLEQRARSSQRLAELGTLTGGLAHEIKNPLSTIGLNVQLLQEDLEELKTPVQDDARPDDAHDEQIGRIQRRFESLSKETRQLRDILEDFLKFAGRVNLDQASTDVNQLIEELVDFFTPHATESGVHLRSQLSAANSTCLIDRTAFKQALLNLLINASQAMANARQKDESGSGGDELIIRTQRVRSVDKSEDLQIDIIDTGPGMSPQTAEKIFHPYFSTKASGTGLGLATARRIIEEHGGSISVHSELGRGTDFVILIPLDV